MKEFVKKNKKAVIIIAILLVVAVSAIAVAAVMKQNGKEETTTAETTTAETTSQQVEEETTETNAGKVASHLSGEPVSEKVASHRPIAVMINNIQDAIPQSGIGNAKVIYEATVEGGITRLMALFDEYEKIKRIGSVRSCRFYFAYWATEWDAYYTHWGQSSYALDFLQSGKVDYLNAMDDSANTTFVKDDSIAAPHNIFATPKGIDATIKSKKYRTKYKKGYEDVLQFAQYGTSVTLDKAVQAKKIELNYPVNHSYFTYDEKSKLYKRFQYEGKHIDKLTNKQLTCKNVIVQKAPAPLFDDGKSVNFAIVGSGEGMYFTEGKGIKIKWEKSDATSRTHFYKENGEELTVNTGKTWICVMPDDQEIKVRKK